MTATLENPTRSDRVPPQNLEAERSVLGSILIEPAALPIAVEIISPQHFYNPHNGCIFAAIIDCGEEYGDEFDSVTVAERLEQQGRLEEIGADVLVAMAREVPTSKHVAYYAEIVRDKWQDRNAIRQANALIERILSGGADRQELAEQADRIRGTIAGESKRRISPVPIDRLIADHPKLREPVVHGLARRGETCNIISASKIGKSWLAYGLALSVAIGRDFLDTFRCKPGRVLFVDNELHKETLASRFRAVAEAMGVDLSAYRDRIDVIPLRGNLCDYPTLGRDIVRRIDEGRYSAIIVDAHYRMFPDGMSENGNSETAQLYNLIDRFAEQTQAVWFLVHHSSKGGQAEKRVTDVGSGAGSQSRAADSHIVLREHEEEGHFVIDAALRSFPPIDPMTLRFEYPTWRLANHIDPSKLKGRLTKAEQRQKESDQEGTEALVDTLLQWDDNVDGPATPNAITGKLPFGRARVDNLLAKMLHNGDVTREPFERRGNMTHIYSLVRNDEN